MIKRLLFLYIFLGLCTTSFSQSSKEKTLFVIDSIPILNDLEEWNPLLEGDIADITVVKNRDSLKLLGYEQLGGVTYIFTREYRKRPDSVKAIPSLKQMEMINGAWHLHGIPYTGNYIDYFTNGRIQSKGTLLVGKMDGEMVVYYKNRNIKTVSNYRDGIENGKKKGYYKNGVLSYTDEMVDAKSTLYKGFYINGQPTYGKFSERKTTRYDTSFTYYSTGKLKEMKLIYNHAVVFNKKVNDGYIYDNLFSQSLNAGDLKNANRYLSKMFDIDSASAAVHTQRGRLLLKEYRFAWAIAEFDKALEIEPFDIVALQNRAFARVKKYQFEKVLPLSSELKLALYNSQDAVAIPAEDREKICIDLKLADNLLNNEYFIVKWVSAMMQNYCSEKE
ncbi:MAG: hypothetical protein ABIN67_16670 [Ferruginibacter sp.]